ncbi:MAG: adenosylcobinamide-GDP ribazoletransferase [Pseudomonadota bacterium]
MSLARRVAEARIALMLLTRLPMGRVADPAPTLGAARWAFPLVGLPVGLAIWAVFTGAEALGLGATLAAWLALAAAAMITGGLHHDGLADFADGIWGGHTVARRLEIMRDSRIGSYGVVALILVMAAMAQAIATVQPSLAEFVAVAVLSRAAMLGLLAALPPARSDGLGQTARANSSWHIVAGMGIAASAALALGSAGVVALLAMAVAAALTGYIARKAIGGQTGDVLGASQMLTELTAWCALVAVT